MGTSAMMNHCEATEMMTNVVTMLNRQPIIWISTIGSVASSVSVSLLKRLMMRPEGVVSKNDIGSRRILASMPACSVRQARRLNQ